MRQGATCKGASRNRLELWQRRCTGKVAGQLQGSTRAMSAAASYARRWLQSASPQRHESGCIHMLSSIKHGECMQWQEGLRSHPAASCRCLRMWGDSP